MNKKITAFAVVLATSAASFGQVIYSQAPTPQGEGGAFSYPTQSIADNFLVASDSSYNHVAFWGSYFATGDRLNVGDQKSFVIRRWSTAATANVPLAKLSESLVNATVTQKTTTNDNGDTVYRFDTDIANNSITGGVQYFLNVEATDTVAGFRWHTSAQADTVAAFTKNGGASWSVSGAPRANMAFELSQAVPEPATLLVMTLGAAVLAKRRRR
jgi:hypothetical protein